MSTPNHSDVFVGQDQISVSKNDEAVLRIDEAGVRIKGTTHTAILDADGLRFDPPKSSLPATTITVPLQFIYDTGTVVATTTATLYKIDKYVTVRYRFPALLVLPSTLPKPIFLKLDISAHPTYQSAIDNAYQGISTLTLFKYLDNASTEIGSDLLQYAITRWPDGTEKIIIHNVITGIDESTPTGTKYIACNSHYKSLTYICV